MPTFVTSARWSLRRLPANPAPRRRRLLVVDDERAGGEATAASLATAGYDAHFAADGATALQMAATWRPDIAVLDINMPVMDGYKLAQRLTHDALTQQTLLVAFTALDEPVARSSGIASRFDAYCQKGGCPGVLLTLLRSLAQ